MFARLSDDIGALDRLADSLAVAGGGNQLKLVCQRYYYAGLVACIENLCLSPHGVSSIERSAVCMICSKRSVPVRWLRLLKAIIGA